MAKLLPAVLLALAGCLLAGVEAGKAERSITRDSISPKALLAPPPSPLWLRVKNKDCRTTCTDARMFPVTSKTLTNEKPTVKSALCGVPVEDEIFEGTWNGGTGACSNYWFSEPENLYLCGCIPRRSYVAWAAPDADCPDGYVRSEFICRYRTNTAAFLGFFENNKCYYDVQQTADANIDRLCVSDSYQYFCVE